MRILLVGEGNLTFSYALIKKLSKSKCFGRYHAPTPQGTTSNTGDAKQKESTPEKPIVTVVVTTFDSREELNEKYPETIPIFHYFTEKTRIRIIYRDRVDATHIAESLVEADGDPVGTRTKGEKEDARYDMVFFNNPHTGKEDLFLQHCLLAHFFASAKQILRQTGNEEEPSQVVVSLCDEQPIRWGLLQAAARSGFACVAAVPFTNAEFPEFDNKRHQSDAKFPFQQMTHFYFVQASIEGNDAISKCALSDLRLVVATNTHDSASTTASCGWEMWLALAKHFGADHSGAHSRAVGRTLPSPRSAKKLIHLPEEVATQVQRECSRWEASTIFGVPLIHPLLCYYSLYHNAEMGAGGDSHESPSGIQETYSPLVPVRYLAALLLIQNDLMTAASVAQGHTLQKEDAAPAVTPPPHLDSSLLGRPLTFKEQAKLLRYEAKLQSASMSSKRKAVRGSATTYGLPFVTDPSAFVEALEADATAAKTYCICCGTDFQTAERFSQHINSLAPVEDRFVCPLCPERKPFKTERALLQHEARAH